MYHPMQFVSAQHQPEGRIFITPEEMLKDQEIIRNMHGKSTRIVRPDGMEAIVSVDRIPVPKQNALGSIGFFVLSFQRDGSNFYHYAFTIDAMGLVLTETGFNHISYADIVINMIRPQ